MRDYIPEVAGRPWIEWKVTGVIGLEDDELGDVHVARFSISHDDAKWENMRAAINARRVHVEPGNYTRLTVGGTLMMSDTFDEIRDHHEPLTWPEKFGPGTTVLVAGLGLGVVVRGLLLHSNVERVVCLELSGDVIELVGRRWQEEFGDDRLELRQCDALEYRPPKGETFTAAWFDIWSTICTDNLDEMAVLHRRWTRRVQTYSSWRRDYLQYERRRERAQERAWPRW